MTLWLTPEQAQQILEQARSASPHEVCGLLGGTAGRVTEVVPIDNTAENPTVRYRLDPAQQATTMSRFYRDGLDLVGIYHSHPQGTPIPSQTDIQQASYPDAIYLIVGLRDNELGAWQIGRQRVTRVPIHVGYARPTSDDVAPNDLHVTAIVASTLLAAILVILFAIYLLPPAPPIPGG